MQVETPLLSTSTKRRIQELDQSESHALLIVGGEVANHEHVASWIAHQKTNAVHTLSAPTIEELRGLHQIVRSTSNAKRIILIQNLDDVKLENQNTLLKLLEEPTQNTQYVLSATELSAVATTIRSRCSLLKLVQPSSQEYLAFLGSYDESAIKSALLAAGGNLPSMQQILDGESDATSLAKQVIGAKPYERLQLIPEIVADKTMPLQVVLAMQGIFRYLLTHDTTGMRRNQFAASLEACFACEEALRKNGQAKLLLGQLFISL